MDTILSEIRRTNEGLADFTSNMVHRFTLLDSFSSEMDHHGVWQHRHQAKEMELTQIRINSSPTRKYGVSLIQD
ncbi:hypothetical protein RW25_05860 [Bacillus sp. L_1B0_8]|nr:hypothetical protein RW25_05860 [Bacillus sp. L_1B0_8]KIQ91684.1 hypothetical protein RT27_01955 [Bacillus sp. L_1B0_5]